MLVPNDQDHRVRGSDSEAGSGQKWSSRQKKQTKDLRSTSRGEGWCGGQKQPGDISEERGSLSFSVPLYKLLHSAGFLSKLQRPGT